MIVVADTSLINYLSLIGHIDILPALYGQIVIPSTVQEEMLHPSAPLAVRALAEHPPRWLEVRTSEPARLRLARILGKGEREAIALAQQRGDSLLLIDDNAGRLQARFLRIEVIGTLGILKEAHHQRLGRCCQTPYGNKLSSLRCSSQINTYRLE